LDPEVRALRDEPDPLKRAKKAISLMVVRQGVIDELARIRREALAELTQGMKQTEVAELLGVTRGRIGQLLKTGPSPERAFLGDGLLTIVIGQKREEGRGRPVVAQETTIAANRLGKLASDYQLSSTEEYVPPPGIVELNKENLVILAGPRLFPLVGQILDGDPHLRFHKDDAGLWYVRDHTAGVDYRALRDDGEPRDIGYIGRLPRPDGRGTFLICAGIHATGTQGAVTYLETSLPDLYREVKTKRFSALVECTYDAESLRVTSASLISPIYRHGS
jgi:hypothetical protein